MGWTLLSPATASSSPKTFQLPYESPRSLVVTKLNGDHTSLGVVGQFLPHIHTELGQITMGEWGVKLEALNEPLGIYPGPVDAHAVVTVAPPAKKYELKPRRGERSEVILLRPGDVISSSHTTIGLVLQWHGPEIQVNSSAADPVETTEPANVGARLPEEDETEDEDANKPVVAVSATQTKSTQAKSQQSRATPGLSNARGLIVQETPTAARFEAKGDSLLVQETEEHLLESLEATPAQSFVQPADEAFSTAHTGESQNQTILNHATVDHGLTSSRNSDVLRNDNSSIVSEDEDETMTDNYTRPKNSSPQVVITPSKLSKKRPSPDAEEVELETNGRSTKRAKTTASSPGKEDTQDSRMSNIIVDTSRKAVPKGKKRTSGISKSGGETSTRLQESSQRSSKAASDTYDGPTPQVAFSNSAIALNSQAAKFLKKHNGSVVESMSDQCNVLCVRPGALTKTMKLLEAIALGIPIVTDKWLLDSAKAGRFLALRDYQPSVPQQEKEWNFQLNKIWGKPQSPFKGYTIYFTPELQSSYSDFDEIREVCKTVGAKVASKKTSKGDKFIVLAREDKDKESDTWIQEGFTCYSKDLLTNSILRGEVDLGSQEFMIGQRGAVPEVTHQPKKKRGRKS